MNCKVINAFVFAAGAVIGSAVTWTVLKNKYEQRIQEEVADVREALAGLGNCDQSEETETEDDEEDTSEQPRQINWDELEDLDEEDDDLDEYAELTNLYSNVKGGAEKVEANKPYVISPYDYGEEDGYSQISLTYYADDILAYEDDEILTEVEEMVGKKSLTTFGDYEEDSVFVRNERLGIEFEILRDPRTYEEATGNSPNTVGGK